MKNNQHRSSCFVRFMMEEYTGYGCVIDDLIYPVKGDIFSDDFIVGKSPVPNDKIKYLPPCVPQKIICVGLNYAEHAAESTIAEMPLEPVLFFKPLSALIGHLDNIVLPDWVDRIDYEGELAVVIGQQLKNVSTEEAREGIFGYTCANDVTARNIQKKDLQWTRAKGFDTFCPLGPHIITNIDANDLGIKTYLNGKVVQKSNSSLQMRPAAEVISYISKVMTLYPGDVLLTGTPKGVGPLKAGDTVEIEIENIGILKNIAVAG